MKWIRLTKSYSAVQVYNLVESKTIKGIMRYHPVQQSVRLSCNGSQRVFFIEMHGFRNSQFSIKNEYGFCEGKIHIDNAGHNEETGLIEYRQQKIQFTFFHNRPVSELVVYGQDGIKPAAVCGLQLEPEEQGHPIYINKSFRGLYAGLIWGLHWCLVSKTVALAPGSQALRILPEENVAVLQY